MTDEPRRGPLYWYVYGLVYALMAMGWFLLVLPTASVLVLTLFAALFGLLLIGLAGYYFYRGLDEWVSLR